MTQLKQLEVQVNGSVLEYLYELTFILYSIESSIELSLKKYI